MRIIQVSRLCTKSMFNQIMKDNNVKIGQSIQKLNRIMVEGFVKNNVKTMVLSERPINNKNCEKKYLPSFEEIEDNVFYHYFRLFNFSLIKAIHVVFASFLWIFLNAKKENDVVIIDTCAFALAVGTICACKIKRIPCIAFVTDIPTKSTYYVNKDKISLKSKINDWFIEETDGKIFLTEQMNDIVNKKNKPFVVIEGFSDSKVVEIPNLIENKYKKWTVMYTGGLEQFYGMDILIEGFIKANISNSQLIFYGGGTFVAKIKKYAEKYPHIIYGGVKDNDEIVKEQIKSTILVNLRYTNNEYTKYSFPGKNLEYMTSGTPTLTTDLPGMPDEYKSYVYILKDETVEGVTLELKKLSSIPREDLHKKGLIAREWMIKEKNSIIQTKKIIKFIEDLAV